MGVSVTPGNDAQGRLCATLAPVRSVAIISVFLSFLCETNNAISGLSPIRVMVKKEIGSNGRISSNGSSISTSEITSNGGISSSSSNGDNNGDDNSNINNKKWMLMITMS